jgi:hypothetical protein
MYGIHFKIIGNCIKRNIMPEKEKPFGKETRYFHRVGVSGGMIKEVCVR